MRFEVASSNVAFYENSWHVCSCTWFRYTPRARPTHGAKLRKATQNGVVPRGSRGANLAGKHDTAFTLQHEYKRENVRPQQALRMAVLLSENARCK